MAKKFPDLYRWTSWLIWFGVHKSLDQVRLHRFNSARSCIFGFSRRSEGGGVFRHGAPRIRDTGCRKSRRHRREQDISSRIYYSKFGGSIERDSFCAYLRSKKIYFVRLVLYVSPRMFSTNAGSRFAKRLSGINQYVICNCQVGRCADVFGL